MRVVANRVRCGRISLEVRLKFKISKIVAFELLGDVRVNFIGFLRLFSLVFPFETRKKKYTCMYLMEISLKFLFATESIAGNTFSSVRTLVAKRVALFM